MYEEKKRRNRCSVFLCLYFFFLLSGEAKAWMTNKLYQSWFIDSLCCHWTLLYFILLIHQLFHLSQVWFKKIYNLGHFSKLKKSKKKKKRTETQSEIVDRKVITLSFHKVTKERTSHKILPHLPCLISSINTAATTFTELHYTEPDKRLSAEVVLSRKRCEWGENVEDVASELLCLQPFDSSPFHLCPNKESETVQCCHVQ